MEKVLLTKEQANAINFALNTERLAYYQNPDALLESHIRSRHFLDELEPLRTLKSVELARALYCGYEVEKTSEEKVSEYYKRLKLMWETEHFIDAKEQYWREMTGVRQTLKILGIEIEGVYQEEVS